MIIFTVTLKVRRREYESKNLRSISLSWCDFIDAETLAFFKLSNTTKN